MTLSGQLTRACLPHPHLSCDSKLGLPSFVAMAMAAVASVTRQGRKINTDRLHSQLVMMRTACSCVGTASKHNVSPSPLLSPAHMTPFALCRFVEYAEDRSTRESQRFWFTVMDADGDGRLSWADMKLLYDAVQRSCSGGILLHFEDLMNQIRDMVSLQRDPTQGFTAPEMWDSKLGAGVIGLLTNANNMLLQRSTAEWGRGEHYGARGLVFVILSERQS